MRIRRPVIVVAALTLLALSAGTPAAVAEPATGGSSLTITALSPDTTTPFSNTQDFIYIQLSGNAPSGGTVISLTSSNQSVMPGRQPVVHRGIRPGHRQDHPGGPGHRLPPRGTMATRSTSPPERTGTCGSPSSARICSAGSPPPG